MNTKVKPQAALGFIFVTLLIDIIGFGIIIPVLPKLIQHLIHGNLSDASRYGGWLAFAYAFMQFICAPLLGNLSDKYGRRPVLLASLLGFSIDYTFLAFAPSIGWLFVGRLIAGVTGASFTTASAYIADISTPEKRAQNFGLIGAAFGLGFIIGPVLGGILGQYSTKLPFIAAAVLALINALYGFFILPESLSMDHRRKFEWKRANPVGSLMQLKKYPAISGLVVSLILIYIAAQAVQSTWTFFTMEKFSWNEAWVGYSLGFVGVMSALVQGWLIRITIPKLGQQKSIWIGLLFYSAGLFLFAFATKGWMMFAILVPYCLGGIAGPALQGLISQEVPPNEQGELQGGLTSLMSATTIVGPPMMTSLFAYFTSKGAPVQFAGAPFMMGGVLMLLSTILAIRSFRTAKKHPVEEVKVESLP
ncbi:MFS transporter, DHA1 family, tetracycline resistance protein [Mucilaginibacter lappiensis]|uniref:DHA1 family tetracycline resistance protein-like MFS transporter n=1 Tax=Mucilaginibacter lappiensis TaxID=354630 RepID=A0ABR6PJ64_9SPHI|nr:TCR/Tet family MFS transporter [Mucilaginibacter lappiensis]MBB6109809.1 DHA1 family tetracycline resistance protein-like MFS transporter [Mucilaginibacter lappiensis]SIR16269.1 MFS transporter, DHA1 family, tetracycline resistance protein [Mucilaginibacter lappiensis]